MDVVAQASATLLVLQRDVARKQVKLLARRSDPLETFEFMTGSGWFVIVFMVEDVDSPYPVYRWYGTASLNGTVLKLPDELPHRIWQVCFNERGEHRQTGAHRSKL